MNIEISDLSYALLGGVLPALIWLWFWLKEDNRHPEPKRLIAICFAAGMLAVWPVLGIENIIYNAFSDPSLKLALWSIVEEVAKLSAAFVVVLWRKEVDEPIDYVIYLITVALGFAALENTLFLLKSMSGGDIANTIVVGNLRFVGATLVHVSSSAIIGVSLAFSFYLRRLLKYIYLSIGVILGIALHTAFNLSIIIGNGRYGMIISGLVWAAVVVLLLILEKVKKVHPV